MNRAGKFTRFVGVDLGGGRGKKTALAVLRADADGVAVIDVAPRTGDRPLYDGALVEALRSHGPETLLCIDAPLTLPPCLRCQVPVCPGQESCVDPAVVTMRRLAAGPDQTAAPGTSGVRGGRTADRDERRGKPAVTPYTQRPADVYLAHHRGLCPPESLGQGTGPLAARAAHLGRALADRFRINENLVEVYPKGTLFALGLQRPYKKHLLERETRVQILEELSGELRFAPGVWREECVQSDHIFEAVVCAYTGYLWARDAWELPLAAAGLRPEDGWIWVPPPERPATAEPSVAQTQAAKA